MVASHWALDVLVPQTDSLSEIHLFVVVDAGLPARSLMLGNVSLKPNRAAIEVAFGSYGPLEAVRTFPGKPYAIVHFFQPQHAAQAAASLDGVPVASITGRPKCNLCDKDGSKMQF